MNTKTNRELAGTPTTKLVCDFCDGEIEVKDVYFLTDRDDKKTVICNDCEKIHGLVEQPSNPDADKALEDAIEEAATKRDFPENDDAFLSFVAGAKSPEAKAYHTKGMYTEEDMVEFQKFVKYYFVIKKGRYRFKVDFYNQDKKVITEKELLEIWKQHKSIKP